MYIFFYLPFFYMQHTRLLAKGRLLSFFIILVAVPIYCAIFLQSAFSTLNLSVAIISFIIVQNFYEIGYIQNDTETIKKEKNPTLRLSPIELDYYEKHKAKIYFFRLFLAIIHAFLLMTLKNDKAYLFIGLSLLIPLTYLIYNHIRGWLNLVLHFFLTVLKYCSIQFLFFETFSFKIFLATLFVYPFINLLDRAATPRFFYKFSQKYNLARARALYYFLCCLLFGYLLYINFIDIKLYLIFFCFFLYRFSIYLLGNSRLKNISLLGIK